MTAQVLARSTRLKSRVPHGTKLQDIPGRVDIPVVSRSAIGARPRSNRQRHFRLVAPAVATGLAAGKPAVYHHHLAPVPVGFILDLASQLAHADIGYRARQVVILDHALDVQILQHDHVGAFHDSRGGLVQEISAHRRNVGMNLRHLDPLPVAAVTAFLHPGQPPLLALQVAQLTFQVARVAGLDGLFTVPTDHHVLDAQIQPDRLSSQRQRLKRHFTGKADEVAPVWRLGDCRHFRDACWNARPADVENTEFGQFQEFTGLVGAFNLALIELIAHRLPVIPRFEAGIASALLEEVFERLILIDQALSETAGRRIGQPRKFTAFPFGDLPSQGNVVMPLLALFPGFAAQVQTAVPDEPRVAEFNRQLLALVSGRVNAESIGFELLVHVEYDNAHSIIMQQVGHAKSR